MTTIAYDRTAGEYDRRYALHDYPGIRAVILETVNASTVVGVTGRRRHGTWVRIAQKSVPRRRCDGDVHDAHPRPGRALNDDYDAARSKP
jgi:hypothetical protein